MSAETCGTFRGSHPLTEDSASPENGRKMPASNRSHRDSHAPCGARRRKADTNTSGTAAPSPRSPPAIGCPQPGPRRTSASSGKRLAQGQVIRSSVRVEPRADDTQESVYLKRLSAEPVSFEVTSSRRLTRLSV